MNLIKKIWDRLFLEERPSISLSFFRIPVAFTVGSVVIPTLFNLTDNYLATAYKTVNTRYFTINVLELVAQSSDTVVMCFVILFYISWFFFLIGLFSQISCIVMTLCCYYFFALNAFHVGTLTWYILLVVLFQMCLTNYHGDYFSVDCLRRGSTDAYRRLRPIFLQRMLQMQIAFTYFYTSLVKIPPFGNWIEESVVYYLMNKPVAGVTKLFLLRDFFADKPELCYIVGISIIAVEFSMPFLLWFKRTRISAIYLGFFFQTLLLLTLDVPATFFFLFPAMLLLFIDPKEILQWIERKRAFNQNSMRSKLLYDGECQFCERGVNALRIMDLYKTLDIKDYHEVTELKMIHPSLTRGDVRSQLHLIEGSGTIYSGFAVFRRLVFTLPMLYPMFFVFYFPGAGVVGPLIYKLIAKNRYLFHFNKVCKNNACFR